MQVTFKVDGLKEAQALMRGFSDRRANAAIATALTRTAGEIREAVQKEMLRAFDRPTPFTLKSVRVEPASAAKLTAAVYISEQRAARAPAPTVVLKPQVEGGTRGTKAMELALRRIGALPSGWLVVPSRSLRLDAYGNISRGIVSQVIAQLRHRVDVGPANGRGLVKAIRKTGAKFIVIPPGSKTEPGVYSADVAGRNITPVFIFVKGAKYRERLDFYGVAERIARARGQPNVERAIGESMERLAARGSA